MLEAFGIAYVFLIGALFYRNSALTAFEDIKTKFSLYPKHYSMPPRWIRKFLRLKKKEMPKFLLYRLYGSIAVLLLTLPAFIICLIPQLNSYIDELLVAFAIFGLADLIMFLILYPIFKRAK